MSESNHFMTEEEYLLESAADFLQSKRRDYCTCATCDNHVPSGTIICMECLNEGTDDFYSLLDEDCESDIEIEE